MKKKEDAEFRQMYQGFEDYFSNPRNRSKSLEKMTEEIFPLVSPVDRERMLMFIALILRAELALKSFNSKERPSYVL